MDANNTNTDACFAAVRVALVYTYPGDSTTPEKEYSIGGFAAEKVLERCSSASLVRASVEFEKLRYALQVVIGRRELGADVDAEAARFFHVAPLDPLQGAETAARTTGRRRRTLELDLELEPDSDSGLLDELDLDLDPEP